MDVLAGVVNERGVQVAAMGVQCVFDRLRLEESFVRMLRALLILRRLPEAVAEVPQQHAAAVQGPHGLLRRERVRRAEGGRHAIDDLAGEEQPKLRRGISGSAGEEQRIGSHSKDRRD